MQRLRQMVRTLLTIGVFMGIIANPLFVQAAPQQTTNIAISLVIDNSGSMQDSDPEKLRATAAEILLELLSPEDLIGVVRFSDTATEVFPLQNAGTDKQPLKEQLNGSFTSNGATDYLKALQMATEQLAAAPADTQKLILFLTDGLPEQQKVAGELPLAAEKYLGLIHEQVANIGAQGITIYPVGFAKDEKELDKTLLEKMAADTMGEAFILTDPRNIAATFFETLAKMKHRNPIENLNGLTAQEQELTVPIGSYTQQVTVLITTNGSELAVSQIEEHPDALLVTHPDYSILTVNQKQPGAGSEVKLAVKTNGEAAVSAVRDLFFKMTVLQPEGNTVKSLSEPFMIEMVLSQLLEDGMIAEAIVLKNGVPDNNPVVLQEQGNLTYAALYEKVDTLGSYQVLIRVKKEDEVIAEASSSFSVKNIPALKSDTILDGEQFQLGEKLTLTSYMQLQNLRVKENENLQVEQYQLYLQKNQNTFRSFALSDRAEDNNGDILSGDGLYTGIIPFDERGTFDAFIRVKGVYKGEGFVQILALGTVKVVDSGTVEVSLLSETGTKRRDGSVRLPVKLTNYSEKPETLVVSMPETLGTVEETVFELAAGESVEAVVNFRLSDKTLQKVELAFRPENKEVLVLEGPTRTVFLVGEKTLLEKSFAIFQDNKLIVLSSVGVVLLLYAIGRLLYHLRIQRKLNDWEEISYYAIEEGPETARTILPPQGKNHLRIAIGQTMEGANLVLAGPLAFELTFTKQLEKKAGIKALVGYQSLFKKHTFVMQVTAHAPGYLKYDGQVVSLLTVEQETTFQADGYIFTCRLEPSEASYRKNLLEGKEV